MAPRRKKPMGLGWVKGVALFVVGGFSGFLTSYWITYRSDYRSALEARLDSFTELSTSVTDNLALLFKVADGTRPKTREDVEALRKSLYDSVAEAHVLAARLDDSDLLVAEYQNAAVELQAASEVVTGPLDARPLIEAAGSYLEAERRLKDEASRSYKSFF